MTWERCRIGSCQRHQACMYAPCRAADRQENPAISTTNTTSRNREGAE